MQNYLLKNGRLIDPLLGLDMVADILVTDGRIAQIGSGLAPGAAHESIDLTGKVIAPGFLDMHVHLREPGFEHKETIATGCASAAAGDRAVESLPSMRRRSRGEHGSPSPSRWTNSAGAAR